MHHDDRLVWDTGHQGYVHKLLTVLAPSSYEEVGVMLGWALRSSAGPVALRWPKTEAPSAGVTGQALEARLVAVGSDVCLIGVGKMLAACEEAAALLRAQQLSATVWDPRCVTPLDPAMLDDAASHPLVLVAEDGVGEGGVGALVSSALMAVGEARPGCSAPGCRSRIWPTAGRPTSSLISTSTARGSLTGCSATSGESAGHRVSSLTYPRLRTDMGAGRHRPLHTVR